MIRPDRMAGRESMFRFFPTPRTGVLAAMLMPALLAACGSGSPTYYTLREWPGAATHGGPETLEIHSPSVSSYLDRDHVVRNDNGGRLKMADDAAWGEPLGEMIGRTLAADLRQRLPDVNVFLQDDASRTAALAYVDLDVTRFAENEQGDAEITAILSVHPPGDGPFRSRTLHYTMPFPSGTTHPVEGLASALSQLLARVADEAARDTLALPPTSHVGGVTPMASVPPNGTGVPASLVPPNG
ncbi:PqiC family protein [Rhizosaccharibacter radicis]|uniref:PqiC family protein n=1 Tax=Rhizosaccharibacter radicis TaxID=2782605 RepID=A0ABT1VZU7_9PROT|nr:PqiC family protein [Acetobacteraceae bacterium KSS12]